jgi:anti-sigma B factor antagonist
VDVRTAYHRASDTTVLSLHGQLDMDSAAALTDVLDQMHRDQTSRIIVDLAGVTFCDSTGLSILVVAHHRAVTAGGYLRLAAPTPFLLRILNVVGVLPAVPAYHSIAAALRGNPDQALTYAPPTDPDPMSNPSMQ